MSVSLASPVIRDLRRPHPEPPSSRTLGSTGYPPCLLVGRMSKEFWRLREPPDRLLFVLDSLPTSILPADIHGSRDLRIIDSFFSGPSSINTPPPLLFQTFAISSSAFSASPSSRHPDPQKRPTNVDSSPNPEDVSVRLCFFVSVRKATGLSVCGGSKIGNTEGVTVLFGFGANGCAIRAGRLTIGYAGVPKPGDEERI